MKGAALSEMKDKWIVVKNELIQSGTSDGFEFDSPNNEGTYNRLQQSQNSLLYKMLLI